VVRYQDHVQKKRDASPGKTAITLLSLNLAHGRHDRAHQLFLTTTEITALILNESFNAEVEKMFLKDFKYCWIMTIDELEEKPLWFRFIVRIAHLTVPML